MSDEIVYIPEVVPLFPLPDVVLFPRSVLRLHIFEPRYRAMTADVLAADAMLSIALLKPGFEPLYETRVAPIHGIVGVGKVIAADELADGRYNILLEGLVRARVVEELPDRAYRRARVEILESFCGADDQQAQRLCTSLRTALGRSPLLESEAREHFMELLDNEADLDMLTDALAGGLPSDAELRQRLLDEPDAVIRARMISDHLGALEAIARNVRRREFGSPDLN